MSQLDTAIDEALVGNDRLRYDKAAKGVLSEKKILAYILKRTIPEFASASLNDIKEPVANYDLMGIIFVYRVCQEFCVNRFNKQHRIAA